MKRYAGLAAIAALVLIFGAAGFAKLVNAASFQEQFAHFGLPYWWIWVTGTVELLGCALIALFKRLPRSLGAAMLATTMAVATGLHLMHDPFALALPAFGLMLLAGYVAFISHHEAAGAPPPLAAGA
jgi:uncharacterized membrane protein YphA (DoxX/SURF4 family)